MDQRELFLSRHASQQNSQSLNLALGLLLLPRSLRRGRRADFPTPSTATASRPRTSHRSAPRLARSGRRCASLVQHGARRGGVRGLGYLVRNRRGTSAGILGGTRALLRLRGRADRAWVDVGPALRALGHRRGRWLGRRPGFCLLLRWARREASSIIANVHLDRRCSSARSGATRARAPTSWSDVGRAARSARGELRRIRRTGLL